MLFFQTDQELIVGHQGEQLTTLPLDQQLFSAGLKVTYRLPGSGRAVRVSSAKIATAWPILTKRGEMARHDDVFHCRSASLEPLKLELVLREPSRRIFVCIRFHLATDCRYDLCCSLSGGDRMEGQQGEVDDALSVYTLAELAVRQVSILNDMNS